MWLEGLDEEEIDWESFSVDPPHLSPESEDIEGYRQLVEFYEGVIDDNAEEIIGLQRTLNAVLLATWRMGYAGFYGGLGTFN